MLGFFCLFVCFLAVATVLGRVTELRRAFCKYLRLTRMMKEQEHK
jgi:hypothetical protein